MNAFSKLFVAVAILFSASYASATVPSFSTSSTSLTAEQCVQLRSELDKYIAYVNAWLAAQPLKKRKLLKPYVDYAIAEAKKYVNKVCPLTVENRVFECKIFGPSFETLTLGLEGSSLVASASPAQVVCSTENACLNIVAQKFPVIVGEQSARCQPGNTSGIVRMSESQIQSLVNAIP